MCESRSHRAALNMLFASSLGRFRNPGAHIERQFSGPFEAMQELMLASRLLRIMPTLSIEDQSLELWDARVPM